MSSNPEQWRVRKPAVISQDGIVAAQHWLAAKAGAKILAAGGNAVDAAVATAFALNAVEPWMSGLGGNGYLVLYRASEKRAYAVNFQGVVPNTIDLERYPLDPDAPATLMGCPGVVDNRNIVGYGSIAIPGAVAGLALALHTFGTRSFDYVLAPAIDLAEQGLPVDWHATLQIALQMQELRKDPGASAVYLPQGCPPQPDTFLPLGNLAKTLRALAENGPEEFYRGTLAELIAADLQAGGSAITLEDLAAYRATLEEPLQGQHRDAVVYGADDSSGARRLLEALRLIEAELHPGPTVSAETYRVYARALDAAFAAHQQRIGQIAEAGCTTHLSVVDREHNLVALTYTLLNRFGSQVVLARSGILMNNALGYFDPRPGRPTSLAGGKRINASNMCPTIAVRDEGRSVLFALGASGAHHIVPAVTQLTALLLDYDMSLEQAFHTPRIDAANRASIRVDAALPDDIRAALAEHFQLEIAPLIVFPKLYACPSGVLHDAASGLNYGMTDPSSPIAAAFSNP
jgi:gamma-glutamyltranspeptidase/glutathione hydrolase